jgi:hypothetical protein
VGVRELSGGEVGRADLAPDLVLRVIGRALDDAAEVLDGLREFVLGAADAAELVVGVPFFGVDLDGAVEARAGFC